MSHTFHSLIARCFLISLITLILGISLLYSQELQSNKPVARKDVAGILTKDQGATGPIWIHSLLPASDSTRMYILKDTKGNEVKLTIKDMDYLKRSFYVPEGYKLTVENGSCYWYGISIEKR